MATRNRTEEFLQYREEAREESTFHASSFGTSTDDDARLLANDGLGANTLDGDSVAVSIPPRWMGIMDEVKHDIGRIETQFEKLKILHQEHLLPGFSESTHAHGHSIEILTAEITRLFQETNLKLKVLGDKQLVLPPQEHALKENLRKALARQLQEISGQFRPAQRNYVNQLRGQEKVFDDDTLLDIDIASEPTLRLGFSEGELASLETHEQLVHERSMEIRKIAESMAELASIMDDLNMLVVDQGSLLDRIDYNLENVETSVAEGLGQIQQSAVTQKKTRTKIALTVLCVLILVV
eukprot:CAMPEP_0174229926 /NCGR_PEP_ID=MMETSP0417-20130205/797_1 /TAXON_ID=242541 /ORGANISM="Mayorella sp, Strain BSH-02190019" /LENGTH=295 /DNA_ID=CAMNT_0015307535 /DNA_START=322 /DNA_END=1206 /DNA_ORIENTATION=+